MHCPGCGWRGPVVPGGPSVWEVSDEHLLDVAAPVLVAAGDLVEDDVTAFRQRAPGYPGTLDALLAEFTDCRTAAHAVAEPTAVERRRMEG